MSAVSRSEIRAIWAEMEAAVQEIAKRRNLKVDYRLTYGDQGIVKVILDPAGEGGSDPWVPTPRDTNDWNLHAYRWGLPKDLPGLKLTLHRHVVTILTIAPRNRKYPLLVWSHTRNTRMKFTLAPSDIAAIKEAAAATAPETRPEPEDTGLSFDKPDPTDQTYKVGQTVWALWEGEWWAAEVVKVAGRWYYVKFEGYSETYRFKAGQLAPDEG